MPVPGLQPHSQPKRSILATSKLTFDTDLVADGLQDVLTVDGAKLSEDFGKACPHILCRKICKAAWMK